jgi:hypothetical protein
VPVLVYINDPVKMFGCDYVIHSQCFTALANFNFTVIRSLKFMSLYCVILDKGNYIKGEEWTLFFLPNLLKPSGNFTYHQV